MQKKISIEYQGRTANKIIQYLVAKSIQLMVPDSIIVNASIPEIGLRTEFYDDRSLPLFKAGHDFNLGKLVYCFNNTNLEGLRISLFGARLEHLPTLDSSRSEILNLLVSQEESNIYPGEILIHVRAEDILLGTHCDYPLTPIHFYRNICETTGLSPVFMGQIGEDRYSMSLKSAFPKARFLRRSLVKDDLTLLTQTEHLICSVSSFAWLGAWLSNKNKAIHLPVLGLFNPMQRPDVNLLPTSDDRYIFYLFPKIEWTASQSQIEAAISSQEAGVKTNSNALNALLLRNAEISFE